jgi:hypothetical protein
MGTIRRFTTLLLLLAVLAAGCTSDGDDGGASSGPPSVTDTPTEAPPAAVKGAYSYANAGLNASVRFDPSGGATLEIDNDTGRTLPKPGLYVENASTGKEIDGKVLSSAAVPDGKTSTFDVTFPPEVRPDTIGLLILLFGPDNYGAFVPPAAG